MRAEAEVPPLMEHLEEVGLRLDQARRMAILLDFDGTLAPIVERPELAMIPDDTRAILDRLSRRPDTWVAVLSGRALADVRGRIGLDGLVYAGNHGMEIAGPGGLQFEEPGAGALRDRLAALNQSLRDALRGIPGAEVEPKGFTTTVHYRRVDPAHWAAVDQAIAATVPRDDAFVVHSGKRVHEVRPRVDWGKGHAALWLLDRVGQSGDLPIFFGDDTTDEDAFLALGNRGITARVGPFTTTGAAYRFANLIDVAKFLIWLQDRPLPRFRQFRNRHQ